ncbi:unnamed protein product [Moneuplotes crassus]|uniref:Uncharacterized protein n=1 Tax=Euplotes crassus TaxID=5936 RepID=A0AAD2D8R1_EUPCR|nr:unnamed protein product [Moneuplotes crassus]
MEPVDPKIEEEHQNEQQKEIEEEQPEGAKEDEKDSEEVNDEKNNKDKNNFLSDYDDNENMWEEILDFNDYDKHIPLSKPMNKYSIVVQDKSIKIKKTEHS